MADIRPFQAVRPADGWAETIAALPYDVYDRKEAKQQVEKEPHSFLAIDRPETQFDDGTDMYSDAVYRKAAQMLRDWLTEGSLIREEKDCYYIYELTMDGRSQTGIGAVCSIDDYVSQVIKKHENTRAEKEQDRIRHVDACSAQTGPIFLAYRRNEKIQEIVRKCKELPPVYDFTKEDGVTHRLWILSDGAQIEAVRSEFAAMDSVYIADGHHRCASAVRVGCMRREAAGECYDKDAEYNYFLSVLFPEDELMILDYNRVVADLGGRSEEGFLKELEEFFTVTKMGTAPYRPKKKGEAGMFLGDAWFCLEMKDGRKSQDPVEGLDVAFLQKYVLDGMLGIKDPKTDRRIDFVGGIRGLEELERRVRGGAAAAFAMYPTDIRELFAVADAGLLMPPKSTWFEPKLRSGLLIHEI